ncbi:MAG: metallophosphoesterase [Solirubrobacteraceae bacterium]
MRTIVVSDLHLGDRRRYDVLRLPVVRDRLLEAIDDADRLVLLGDTLELMYRHPLRAIAAAEPVLRALGRMLGRTREVIVVPGNHDAPLVRGWALAQGGRLRASGEVPATASPALERLVTWLAPARVRVSYPGVWLHPRIWATHGHYLDHHLIPESAAGVLRPRRGGSGSRAATPIEYEHVHLRTRRSRESFPERLMARPVGTLLESAGAMVRAATIPALPRLLRSTGMAPVTAALLDVQMRRAAVPAMRRVVQRLGIEADWVLFGHVHRRGPIGDEPWPAGAGPRFLNPGAWLYEPLLVDRATTPHPYWPGGAVLLEDDRPPQTVGLLDDVGAAQLQAMFSVG